MEVLCDFPLESSRLSVLFCLEGCYLVSAQITWACDNRQSGMHESYWCSSWQLLPRSDCFEWVEAKHNVCSG